MILLTAAALLSGIPLRLWLASKRMKQIGEQVDLTLRETLASYPSQNPSTPQILGAPTSTRSVSASTEDSNTVWNGESRSMAVGQGSG